MIPLLIEKLRSVLPADRSFIALHEPNFQGHEWDYVKECLDTGWVSSVGKYVDLFEQQLAAYTGVHHAVAVVNGTAALHISLLLVGVEAGDEVLMPTLTFIATANAVTYCGAIPHFVDSEERTLGLDPRKLDAYLAEIAEVRGDGCFNKQTGRRIKAVVPMHTFGHPVDLDPLLDLCERYQLELVEDAAESLGSFYKGKHTGGFGRIAALSFNGNKVITTGGGGAILTNDPGLAQRAKHLTTTAKVPHKWEYNHDAVGYNYRLPNLNAALGCAQLEQLPGFLEQKRALAQHYQEALQDMAGLTFVTEPDFATSNYWLNAIVLDEAQAQLRDELLKATNEQGIMTRPFWTGMHKLPMFAQCPRMDLAVAESLERRTINIPSSTFLGGRHDEA
ncbi:LegC family aminotransferase [Tumebacillus sp. BK434]|uniref:LegC family aminotransferase n=1 Tax=Tumebacillus sp. BK434 TaxID=2512169 RepID=UPI001A9F01FD|nr:LegC family aminotransferase [Tumebacillus sp. BK434]